MRLRTTSLITAVLLGLAVPAAAQPTQGPYLSVGGGVNYLLDMDLNDFPDGLTEVEFDIGWAAIVAGGYRLENGLRPEVEVGFRKNDVDKVTRSEEGNVSGRGEMRALNFMTNVLYDINFGSDFTPYVGAGIGGAMVDADGIGVPGVSFNDRQLAFAYQGIVGASYKISEEVEAFADYRYFSTVGLDLSDSSLGAAEFDDEYSSHTVIVGIRWTFAPPGSIPPPREAPRAVPTAAPTVVPGAPPPLAPGVPDTGAAALGATGVPQREFIVYFEWDQSKLTEKSKAIIKQAAEYVRQGGAARVTVIGHTDRSGPDGYNLKLSQRRAQVVWGEMVALGMDGNIIKVDWMGERRPAVPTADGVREPKNRRAEITLE